MMKNCLANNIEEVNTLVSNLGFKLSAQEQELQGKYLVKCVFMKWLNAGEAIMEMIVTKLPSPIVAQKYRTCNLYEGPLDDQCA
jgi:elongation factor 2